MFKALAGSSNSYEGVESSLWEGSDECMDGAWTMALGVGIGPEICWLSAP